MSIKFFLSSLFIFVDICLQYSIINSMKTTTTLKTTAQNLIKTLKTDKLIDFAKTAPVEIIDLVLNELELRLPESEFIQLCETL